MNYVWTVAGDDPDFPTGDKHGIDGYFYPMFDSVTTGHQLLLTQNAGHARGLYAAENWAQFGGKTPAQIAQLVKGEVVRIVHEEPSVSNIRVQWNDERHDPDAIASILEAIRALLPKTGLSWSFEGMQGGWIGPVVSPSVEPSSFVKRLLGTKVRFVPEAYYGEQGRIDGLWAADQILRDLTKRGVPESSVSLFYDAAALPRGWDGYAFTMGRLPA